MLRLLLFFFLLPAALAAETPSIPYESFVLDNGLKVIVHEDRKAPVVAVNIWYHVGSKNEAEGRTGFAHLFEHLMFNGSENYNDEYFKPFEEVGATGMNGTTNFDRTNYFQVVPKTALDLALWMESDRMGNLLGVVDQDRLDEQRGVVQNEKRQGENQPYGKVFGEIVESIFPVGHPYSWLPIGSMEDLNAATLDDVRTWFKTYYGPNNAVLVLAGDIDLETARDRVTHFFGAIPPGPPLTKHDEWNPTLTEDQRTVMQDRVPQARVYRVWIAPHYAHADAPLFGLMNAALVSGKTSRLYQRLVYEDQIATDVGSFPMFGEIGGLYALWATAQPGVDLEDVEAALDEELERVVKRGFTKSEIERVKTQSRAGFIRGIERVGGFGGKSSILAQNEVLAGSPDYYRYYQGTVESAKPRAVSKVARAWLERPTLTIEVHPFSRELKASGDPEGVDRTALPFPDSFPPPRFPDFVRGQLDNGLKLLVANRPELPVVLMSLQLDAGYAADQLGKPGTARMTMSMLDEGTEELDALQISAEADRLGAIISTGSNLDTSVVSLSALKDNLVPSLQLFADVLLRPTFPENELERLRKLQLADIQREKVTPTSMGLRVLPNLLYGDDHAYSIPLTGSGTESAVAALSRSDLEAFHESWFKPNNGSLIVVGDTTIDEIKPILEEALAGWTAGAVPEKNIGAAKAAQKRRVYLVDRPQAPQSIIIAGQLIPPKANPDEFAFNIMDEVLGASFTSRLNMNLREDKAWSYGVSTNLVQAEGQRPYFAFAPVQADRTVDALKEIDREFSDILTERPASEEEVAVAKKRGTLTLPGRWETGRAVAGSLAEIVRFGLPDDYWKSYAQRVDAVDQSSVDAAAQKLLTPGTLTWVIVGDRSLLEDELKALGLGEVVLIDADGNVLGDTGAASP